VKPFLKLLAILLLALSIGLPIQMATMASTSTELAYDDGEPENLSGGGAGSYQAVRFSPPSGWPSARILSVSYYIGKPGAPFKAHIFGSDGAAELLTPPLEVKPTAIGWFNIDLTTYNIVVSGDFYVAMQYEAKFDPSIGLDLTNPHSRSYVGSPGKWAPFGRGPPAGDLMIRAVVEQSAPASTTSTTSTSIQRQPQPSQFPAPLLLIAIPFLALAAVILRRRKKRRGESQKPMPTLTPPTCPRCGRDLSTLPRDIKNCPYCGKAVSTPSIEVKPAVKVELPANVQRIRKCAKRVALLGLLIALVSFILGPFLGGSMGSEHTYMFSVLHEYQNAIGNGVLVGISIAIASAIVRTIAGSLVRSQIVEGGELVLRWILGIVMILLSVTSTFFGMPFLLDWYALGLLIAICLLVPKKYSMKSSIILLALALVYALWPQPPQGGGLTFGPSLFEDISWLITSWLHAISTTTWGMSQIDFWALLCEKVLSIFAGALLITRKIWFQEKRR
jgi:hypothetical protein